MLQTQEETIKHRCNAYTVSNRNTGMPKGGDGEKSSKEKKHRLTRSLPSGRTKRWIAYTADITPSLILPFRMSGHWPMEAKKWSKEKS